MVERGSPMVFFNDQFAVAINQFQLILGNKHIEYEQVLFIPLDVRDSVINDFLRITKI
jgi:hypothetical protein